MARTRKSAFDSKLARKLVVRIAERNVLCAVVPCVDKDFCWIRAIKDAGANPYPSVGGHNFWKNGMAKRVHAQWLAEQSEQG